jgi:hypothetical protein
MLAHFPGTLVWKGSVLVCQLPSEVLGGSRSVLSIAPCLWRPAKHRFQPILVRRIRQLFPQAHHRLVYHRLVGLLSGVAPMKARPRTPATATSRLMLCRLQTLSSCYNLNTFFCGPLGDGSVMYPKSLRHLSQRIVSAGIRRCTRSGWATTWPISWSNSPLTEPSSRGGWWNRPSMGTGEGMGCSKRASGCI